jgi:hypothetical protein
MSSLSAAMIAALAASVDLPIEAGELPAVTEIVNGQLDRISRWPNAGLFGASPFAPEPPAPDAEEEWGDYATR